MIDAQTNTCQNRHCTAVPRKPHKLLGLPIREALPGCCCPYVLLVGWTREDQQGSIPKTPPEDDDDDDEEEEEEGKGGVRHSE